MAIEPERRAEINRRNAEKSTGPKTPEGKAASRGNALKHGLTATTIAPVGSPGEGEGDYQKRLDWWLDDLKPRNVLELAMVRQACRATWKLDRCARFEDAAASRRAARPPVLDDPERCSARQRAAKLGAMLMLALDLPPPELLAIEGFPEPPRGSYYNPFDDAPGRADELGSFKEGVDWLLNEWSCVLFDLPADGADAEGSEAFAARAEARALRLLGVSTGSPRPSQPLRAAGEAEVRRLEKRGGELGGLAESRVDRDLALLEAGPSADLLLRYEAGAERELHRATSAFLNLRKHSESLEASGPVAAAAECAAPAPRPKPERSPTRRSMPAGRNEAGRDERPGPDSGPKTSPARSASGRNRL